MLLLLESATMATRGAAFTLLVCLMSSGQATTGKDKAKPTAPQSSQAQVIGDLKQRLAKFREVEMPFHSEELPARDKQLVLKLVEACRYLENIYWRQVDPDALALYKCLEGKTSPQDVELRRFLWINGSRFDLLNGNKPFLRGVGVSPGGGFY